MFCSILQAQQRLFQYPQRRLFEMLSAEWGKTSTFTILPQLLISILCGLQFRLPQFYPAALARIGPSHGELGYFVWTQFLTYSILPPFPPKSELFIENFSETSAVYRKVTVSLTNFQSFALFAQDLLLSDYITLFSLNTK